MAVTINGSTGVQYTDDVKQKYGTGDDLEIYHQSSNNASYIKEGGAGNLYIFSENLRIENADGSESYIEANANGSVELYYDGTKKFETSSGGADVTGGFSVTGDVHFNSATNAGKDVYWDESASELTFSDNVYASFGTGEDLKIYHESDNSYIANSTGHLIINSSATTNVDIMKAGYSEYLARFKPDAAVELYYNNSKKFETFGEGITLNGGASSCEVKMLSNDSLRGYLYVNSSSNMGFLTNSGGWRFQVENDGDYIFYGSNVSDRDRKDNITTVTGTSLDKITKLVPKTYNWKATDDGKTPTDKIFTGFIAQEVNEHLPSLVTGTDGQKNMAIDYNGLLAHAVKAITELSAEVETLKTKVAALEAA